MNMMQTQRMSKLFVTFGERIWGNLPVMLLSTQKEQGVSKVVLGETFQLLTTRLSLGKGLGAGRGVEEGFTVFLSSIANFEPWNATSSKTKQF